METILSTFAITISLLTLVYVVWSGQKHSKQLSDQIKSLSEQTDLLRKQIFGEVYEEAQIRSLQFFLPAKANLPIAVFEEIQKEDEEVVLGQEIKINRRWETELHVQFWMDAPQRLRLISWGFPANVEENEYPDRPNIVEYRRPFASEITSQFEREVYQDWHGYWHIEFPFPRFLPKEYCLTICFTIKGDRPGKFPLEFEIATDEAKAPHKECLWIEITE